MAGGLRGPEQTLCTLGVRHLVLCPQQEEHRAGDLSDGRCGADALSVGIGYHTLFGADSSLYGTLSVENVDIDNYDSDSGLVAAVGLRGFINQQVEAKVQLAHHTAFDGNTVLSGGLAYWFARNFAATADVGLGTEASEIALGVRMNF